MYKHLIKGIPSTRDAFNEVVSVIVLCYQNAPDVFRTLNSVFVQKFMQIELIVSDDASTNFPAQEIEAYILRHAQSNIVSCIINQNKENVGTVVHVKAMIDCSNGTYIKMLACGDCLYTPDSLSELVEHIKKTQATAVVSQFIQCKKWGDKVGYSSPLIADMDKLCRLTTLELYKKLLMENCIPSAGSFFCKEVFTKYPNFGDGYRLMEDWPLWMTLCRAQEPIAFLYQTTAIYVRGGISTKKQKSSKMSLLDQDILTFYFKEVEPHLEALTKWQKRKACFMQKKIEALSSCRFEKVLKFTMLHADIIIVRKLKRWRAGFGSCKIIYCDDIDL